MIFFISCCFNNLFTIPVVNENANIKLALAIPAEPTIKLAKEPIEMLPLVIDTRFFNKKNFYKKMGLKNLKILEK